MQGSGALPLLGAAKWQGISEVGRTTPSVGEPQDRPIFFAGTVTRDAAVAIAGLGFPR